MRYLARFVASVVLLSTVPLAVVAVDEAGAGAATKPVPGVIAAVGDSITAATDVGWCCVNPGGGNPQYSWATGTDSAVNSLSSQLTALRREKGGSPVASVNLSKPGADSADLGAQLQAVAAARPAGSPVDFVTVLIGGNDLCVRSVSAMTDAAVFRDRVRAAFADFFRALPGSRMFVSSIPNLYKLWQVERDQNLAQLIWNTFGICPSMLDSSRTEAERQAVLEREQQLNGILAAECKRQRGCRWDRYAVYKATFTSAHVSPVDHYHPSIAGQRLLAKLAAHAIDWPN